MEVIHLAILLTIEVSAIVFLIYGISRLINFLLK